MAKFGFLSNTSKEQQLDFIALLETGRDDFSQTDLNKICRERNFMWSWTLPHGRSGGILMGCNVDVFDIGLTDHGDFYLKFHLRNKIDDFKWILVAVYGAAQPEFKECFLTELVHACRIESLSIMIGGDFNIIRSPEEKSNDRYNDRWPFLFNAVIDSLDLREIELSGRQFTWANDKLMRNLIGF